MLSCCWKLTARSGVAFAGLTGTAGLGGDAGLGDGLAHEGCPLPLLAGAPPPNLDGFEGATGFAGAAGAGAAPPTWGAFLPGLGGTGGRDTGRFGGSAGLAGLLDFCDAKPDAPRCASSRVRMLRPD